MKHNILHFFLTPFDLKSFNLKKCHVIVKGCSAYSRVVLIDIFAVACSAYSDTTVQNEVLTQKVPIHFNFTVVFT